jgi:allantoin racemase
MKVQYLVPGPMSKGPMGDAEVKRREGLLREWAFAGTSVEVVDVPDGPASIESSYEELLSVPATLDGVRAAQAKGLDAVILGCFGDPGLEAARELVDIPVIGPGESSMLLAASLGHRFTVVTILDSVIAAQEIQAYKAGVRDKLASVRATDIPVLSLMKDRTTTLNRVIEVGRRAVEEDRADSLVLGCMTMSFLGVAPEVSAALGVPVINAGLAALKSAEALVSMQMSHSKRAFPTPPKLRARTATVNKEVPA